MARHRIGNDITIVWTVNDGNGNPLPLSDKEVHLFYTCERGRYEAEITIRDTNTVVWDFYGGLQKTLGAYSLTLEILQSEGKRSIKKDVCGAFVLVGKDCEADAKETTVNGELAVYQEMITTNLDIARISPIIPVIVEDENGVGYWHVDGVNTGERATGESAYDYAVSKGYEGTEEEYAELLASLSKDISDISEINQKLEDLQEKDEATDVVLDELKIAVALRNVSAVDADGNAELPEAPGAGGSYDDAEIRAELAELSAEVNEVAEKIDNINPTPMISVTYAELVTLRENGELVAGMQYRITDFVTTTAQENTRSAGHQFDIIVTADNENTLNEVARACRSEFDIEKYKDAYSESWGESMQYVGIYEHEGKEYYLYEADSQDLQMLMDFNSPNILYNTYLGRAYPYEFYPTYGRLKGEAWGEWRRELGEFISFKYNLAEDTYFKDSNLAAWQIWYSLDNDSERFAWATVDAIKVYDAEDDSSLIYKRHKLHDTNLFAWAKVINSEDSEFGEVIDWDNLDDSDLIFTEFENIALGSTLIRQGDISVEVVDRQYGKGVIYRMIDEWNNDCPYDFKNIQFKRNLIFDNGFAEYSDNGDATWVYTFAGKSYHINNDEWSELKDGSLESPYGHMSDENTSTFHDNTIKPYIMLYNENDIYTECGIRYLNDIVFLGYWEQLGSMPNEGAYYYAYGCNSNSFGNNCHNNSFGNNCNSNSFGNNCHNNSFGNDCHNNSFGNNCHNNSFGNDCHNNSFGNDCHFNSFGNGCYSNSFGNGCSNNSFGSHFQYNSFGNGCYSNSFGNLCCYNSFGNSCNRNSFVDEDGLMNQLETSRIDDGVNNVRFFIDGDSDAHRIKNNHFCRGIENRTVEIMVTDNEYEETYSMTSDGELRNYCIADVV